MPSLMNIQGDISQHLHISGRPGAKSEVKAGWNTRGEGGYVKKSFRERIDVVGRSDCNVTDLLCMIGTHLSFCIWQT